MVFLTLQVAICIKRKTSWQEKKKKKKKKKKKNYAQVKLTSDFVMFTKQFGHEYRFHVAAPGRFVQMLSEIDLY